MSSENVWILFVDVKLSIKKTLAATLPALSCYFKVYILLSKIAVSFCAL